MSNIVVTGCQWGDEGKGKIVDFLSEKADVVARFQGGGNAGHTITINDDVYKLSLLPSGIIRKNKICIIGNGVVLDPVQLVNEIKNLKEKNIIVNADNLWIASNVHLILSIHKEKDAIFEELRGSNKVGTTGKGIGPCYEDKAGRRGIRICDLYDSNSFDKKIDGLINYHNIIRKGLNKDLINKQNILDEINSIKDELEKYCKFISKELLELQKQNKHILFEGAQGALLDIDHGTYPFVTSSSTVCSQLFSGVGFGINQKVHSLGITKAYATRVGNGPFPTELQNDIGHHLQNIGKEFGTITGRNRRCGWLDIVLLKQVINTSGIDSICITKLDILDNMEEIKICTSYQVDGKIIDYLPFNNQDNIEPVYETINGWKESTANIQKWDQLPKNAQNYIKKIEELIEIPVNIISTGPERDSTIVIQDIFDLD